MDLKFNEVNKEEIDDFLNKSNDEMNWNIMHTNYSKLYIISKNNINIGFFRISDYEIRKGRVIKILSHIWIEKEYRGKNIGVKVVGYVFEKYSPFLAISEPNKKIIGILKKNKLAKNISENTILSNIALQMDISKIMPNFNGTGLTPLYFNKGNGSLLFNVNSHNLNVSSDYYNIINIKKEGKLSEYMEKNRALVEECSNEIDSNTLVNKVFMQSENYIPKIWLL